MITTEKINDVVVTVDKTKKDKDTRLAKGYKLFSEPYANIFICAKKKSGKTVLLQNILKQTVGRDTQVIFFCSTIYKDDTYLGIMKMLKKMGINYHAYTSMKEMTENGVIDNLAVLTETLIEMSKDDFNDDEDEEKQTDKSHLFYNIDEEDEKGQAKQKKEKYIAPSYIIILDDLSTELKNTALVSLQKKNRHINSKIIVSSQHYNDMLPSSRLQQDYLILFKNIPADKLKEIYQDISTPISMDEFFKAYHLCTKEKFNFLYCDLVNDEFRMNFNKRLNFKK
jgi:hypothetical protein